MNDAEWIEYLQKHASTTARIAGNIASGLVGGMPAVWTMTNFEKDAVVGVSVELARRIMRECTK